MADVCVGEIPFPNEFLKNSMQPFLTLLFVLPFIFPSANLN